MISHRQTFAVIGLGTFGQAVALELSRFGDNVIGIDLQASAVDDVADDIASAVIADARSEDALREAGVGEVDAAIVAQASDLESSVMAAINLQMLGVKTVWAKATTETHHRILTKLGVDRVIHPEEEVGRQIAAALHNPLVRDDMSLGNGLTVISFAAPMSLKGRGLDSLKLEKRRVRCLGVMREAEFVGSDATPCELAEDDLLLLLGRDGDLREFMERV